MKKNRGYTLIEMILVIAITVILAGVSFITVGVIRDAKRISAVEKFNNQLNHYFLQTKAVSEPTYSDKTAAAGKETVAADKKLVLLIKKRTDGSYGMVSGYLDTAETSVKDASGNAVDVNDDAKCEAILEKDITSIVYTPSSSGQKKEIDGGIIVQYVKSDGSLRYGAGEYEMHTKKLGDDNHLYTTIVLDPITGQHHTK